MSEQSLLLQYWLDAERCWICAPQVDQNNYPEMLGKTAIINAGAVINFVFPFVKPFLDKRTVNKIEVRGAWPCSHRWNGDMFINFVFPFVKPFLDKRTVNKIGVRAAAGVQADERLDVS
jgi:quinol-cytochrome oxidoreductase complex cytochrome b subunit